MELGLFDCIEALRPPKRGARLYLRGRWVATIWHSKIWGWQWAKIAQDGEPSTGGQCSSFADGFDKLRDGIAFDDEAKPITPKQWRAVIAWARADD